ncbi:MAG: tRNA (adenosine(37)-N6)-dimethylallyltransferase MiaA, partial [Actinomycetota bacterium]
YAQILKALEGRCTLEEAVTETKRRTRAFARRQLTWFRADPRVLWFEADPQAAAEFLVQARNRAA